MSDDLKHDALQSHSDDERNESAIFYTPEEKEEAEREYLEHMLMDIKAGATGPWSLGIFDAALAQAAVPEGGGQIDRIEATGPTPAKQVGDLGQVSVGATGAEVTTVGLMGWTIDWKRTVVKSTTTDGNGYAGNLPSTAEWTATVEAAYVDGDTSQDQIRNAITTLQLTSNKYNFFNAPVTGRDSWSGTGYLTAIKFTSKIGAIFGMSLTISGDGPLVETVQLAPMTGTNPALIAEN